MSSEPNELWQAVYAAFPYAPEVVQREINRIAIKCLKKADVWDGQESFDPSTCDVCEVDIAGADLDNLVRYHNRVKVTGRTTPIVLVRTRGKDVVIEGNNRVNRWVSERALERRKALIISPRPLAPTA